MSLLLQQQMHLALATRQQLVQLLKAQPIEQAVLYGLPSSLQTQPLHRLEQITVNPIELPDAAMATTAALSDLYRQQEDTQSQKVRRYPGLIRLASTAEVPLAQTVAQLNQATESFKRELHRLSNAHTQPQDIRFELIHQLAPHLITMHFYRTPMVATKAIRRIRFGWVAKRIVAKVTKKAILERLHNALTNPGKAILDMNAWQDMVAQEYRAIEALPSYVELRIDRPGGLRPTAFIQYDDGSRSQTPANLPIICQQSHPITLAPLPTWQQQAYPAAKGERLIERLHLYRIN